MGKLDDITKKNERTNGMERKNFAFSNCSFEPSIKESKYEKLKKKII